MHSHSAENRKKCTHIVHFYYLCTQNTINERHGIETLAIKT